MPEIDALTAVAALGGYLFGSLSAAIIVCRLMGLPDPRTTGSGNPGTTNVLRSGGKFAAALTLLGDMLKGVIPVLAVNLLEWGSAASAASCFGAFLGHLYPLFFRFAGGKGVATALGALLALSWITGLLAIATWLATSLCFRISSLAAIITFALVPLYLWILALPVSYVAIYIAIAAFLVWRHRSNVRNLLDGTEPRIGQSKKT